MTYVITQPCIGVKDKACFKVCPCDCIHEGVRMLYIDPESCIDCGACEPACPVQAIFIDTEVPEKWAHFVSINARFFPDKDESAAWANVNSATP